MNGFLWDLGVKHWELFHSKICMVVPTISVYFTAMANGNSKMFNTSDLWSYIERGGLEPVNVIDGLGYAHSLIECMKKDA